jgi:hypothetical protein
MANDSGAVMGMRIGRGNRGFLRKDLPAPMTLHQLKVPNHMSWDRTQASEVGSRQLTALATTYPDKETEEDVSLKNLIHVKGAPQYKILRPTDTKIAVQCGPNCIYYKHVINRNWTATGYGFDGRGSIPSMGKTFFSSPQCPDRLWGPSRLLYNGYRWQFPGE